MRKAFVLVFSAVLILIFAGCSKSDMINAEENGVVTSDVNAAAENTKQINRLIEGLKNGDSLYFPEGVYYIEASEKNGGIKIDKKKNIKITSDNATLINVSYSPHNKEDKYYTSNVFDVSESENISIEGVNIDYINHVNACGEVVKTDGVSTYIKLEEEFLKGEKNAVTGGEYVTCVNVIDENGVSARESRAPRNVGFSGKIDDIENGIYKVEGVYGQEGSFVIMRFASGETSSPAVYVRETNGFKMKDVNVYACPGNVFYAPYGSGSIMFENVKAKSKSGNPLSWAVNEDGINTGGIYNDIAIKNCEFTGIGGNGINIYNSACRVEKIRGSSVEIVLAKSGENVGAAWAKKGDTVEFYDSEMKSVGRYIVKKFKNGKLKLDGNTKDLSKGLFVCNRSQISGAEIENIRVDKGAKNGIIIQSDNAFVKDSTIKNVVLSAVVVAPDVFSKNELAPAQNVEISGNIFENCCGGDSDANDGVVAVKALQGQDKRTYKNVFNNINIKNNNFFNSGAAEIYLSAVTNYNIEENKNEYGELKRDRIKLVNCEK